MGFSKQRFALHFSVPLSEQDWKNLDNSKVKLVMLPLPFCDANTLWQLRGRGCRVVIRIPESDYYLPTDPARILTAVIEAMKFCPVEAVIVGIEPDDRFVLSYGEPTWGQDQAYLHRYQFDAVRFLLQPYVRVISPGLKTAVRFPDGHIGRTISEDDPPAAGVRDWVMIGVLPQPKPDGGGMGYGWDDAFGNSIHYYAYNWDGIVNDLRYKIDGKWWATLLHKPLWIGEVGVGSERLSDVERMEAAIDMSEILLSRVNSRQHMFGQRCELLCPFVSNGQPDGHWESYLLLDDPQAYVELGRWMAV